MLLSDEEAGEARPPLGRARFLAAVLVILAAVSPFPLRPARAGEADGAESAPQAPAEGGERAAPSGEPVVSGKSGHGWVEAQIGYYHQEDGGGNPYLEEDLTVIEPIILFSHNVTDTVAIEGELSYDSVSSASIDRLSAYPDQSGASGDNYVGGRLGVRLDAEDDLHLNAYASFATEYDYRSIGFGGGLAWDLAEGNTSLSASIGTFLDRIDRFRFTEEQAVGGIGLVPQATAFGVQRLPDGAELGSEDRKTITLRLGWYQMLAPDLHAEFGYTLTGQWGFLESNINTVYILDPSRTPSPFLDTFLPGYESPERLPGRRIRNTLHGRVRWYLPSDSGTAVELGGRLYGDDWGVRSATVEPRLYQWLLRDRLLARLRYRFYQQRRATAYRRTFVAPERHQTQDPDLGTFFAQTIGLRLSIYPTDSQEVSASADYTFHSDGLDYFRLGIGWRLEY